MTWEISQDPYCTQASPIRDQVGVAVSPTLPQVTRLHVTERDAHIRM